MMMSSDPRALVLATDDDRVELLEEDEAVDDEDGVLTNGIGRLEVEAIG